MSSGRLQGFTPSVERLAARKANDNAGVAAANQIVGFFEKGAWQAQERLDHVLCRRRADSVDSGYQAGRSGSALQVVMSPLVERLCRDLPDSCNPARRDTLFSESLRRLVGGFGGSRVIPFHIMSRPSDLREVLLALTSQEVIQYVWSSGVLAATKGEGRENSTLLHRFLSAAKGSVRAYRVHDRSEFHGPRQAFIDHLRPAWCKSFFE